MKKNEVLNEIKSKIELILSSKDMENVSFDIEESKDLSIDPRTGKFRLVVKDNMNPPQ